MIRSISALVASALLVSVAVFHLVWAVGIYWPAHDEQEFLNMFWGETNPMPPLWTGGILALILLAGTFVLLRVSFRKPLPGPGWLWQTGMWAMIAVFTLRGVLGFLPSLAGELQPFIRLNKVLYSPLCLVLAVLSTLAITVKVPKRNR